MAIKIIYNPDNKLTILYDMIGELNELVAHELKHLEQMDSGYKFPKKKIKKISYDNNINQDYNTTNVNYFKKIRFII